MEDKKIHAVKTERGFWVASQMNAGVLPKELRDQCWTNENKANLAIDNYYLNKVEDKKEIKEG